MQWFHHHFPEVSLFETLLNYGIVFLFFLCTCPRPIVLQLQSHIIAFVLKLSDGLSNENILLFPVLIQARRNIFTANFFIDTEYELYHYLQKKISDLKCGLT